MATPLNEEVGLHTQVSFNTYLNEYIAATGVTFGGTYTPFTLHFSSNGITWGNDIEVAPLNVNNPYWYTSITSPGYKEGTSGQVFDVSYWQVTQPQSTSDTRYVQEFTIH